MINVSWEEVPAIDQNGEIVMYEIRFDPLMFEGQIFTNTVNVTSSSLDVDLTGLEEYVEYTISVRAYTSAGPGPYSLGIVEITLTDGKRHMLDIFTLHAQFIVPLSRAI